MPDPRTALVTGAASGIGLAIAGRLARDGLRVLMADRSETVEEAARHLAGQGHPAAARVVDVGEESQLLNLTQALQREFDGCDVLVNCAGVHPKTGGSHHPMADIATAEWEQVLRVNLTAAFVLCRELVPGMQRRAGAA